MSGRSHRHNRHRGHQGGGLPSFFEGRSFPLDRSRRGLLAANPPNVLPSDKEVYFDDEIFREIEDYAVEAKREDNVQASDPPSLCARIGRLVV